mgnify:FL=1
MASFFFNNKKQKTYWQIGNVINIVSTSIAYEFRNEIKGFIGVEAGDVVIGVFAFLLIAWMYLGSTILENLGVGKD